MSYRRALAGGRVTLKPCGGRGPNDPKRWVVLLDGVRVDAYLSHRRAYALALNLAVHYTYTKDTLSPAFPF